MSITEADQIGRQQEKSADMRSDVHILRRVVCWIYCGLLGVSFVGFTVDYRAISFVGFAVDYCFDQSRIKKTTNLHVCKQRGKQRL